MSESAQSIKQARAARARLIRRRVATGAVTLFVGAWALIAVELVTGHDPALAAHKSTTSSSGSSATTAASSTGSSDSSGATSSDDSTGSSDLTGSASSDGSTGSTGSTGSASSGGSTGSASQSTGPSAVTTQQS